MNSIGKIIHKTTMFQLQLPELKKFSQDFFFLKKKDERGKSKAKRTVIFAFWWRKNCFFRNASELFICEIGLACFRSCLGAFWFADFAAVYGLYGYVHGICEHPLLVRFSRITPILNSSFWQRKVIICLPNGLLNISQEPTRVSMHNLVPKRHQVLRGCKIVCILFFSGSQRHDHIILFSWKWGLNKE